MKVWGGKDQPSHKRNKYPYDEEEDFVDWNSVWEKEDYLYSREIEDEQDETDDFEEAYEIAPRPRRQTAPARDKQPAAQHSARRKVKKRRAEPEVEAPKARRSAYAEEKSNARRRVHEEEIPKPRREKATAEAQKSRRGKKQKGKKKRHVLRKLITAVVLLGSIYSILVFSDIPFIAKWRAIYIETAMSTMTHQWLATAFIPKSVIDQVMSDRYLLDEEQTGLVSNWSNAKFGFDSQKPWESDRDYFFRVFHEVDESSFDSYAEKHKDEVYAKDGTVKLDKAGLKDGGTDIKTKQGDEVVAIDAENGILIVKVTGDGFVGKLAIIKDPAQVGIGLAKNFGTKGGGIEKLVNYNDAILGINASGFEDPNGTGNGGKAYGLVISNGKIYQDMIGSANKVIGFDEKNRLHIGQYKSLSGFRDAVEFKPALIINGEQLVHSSAGWGIQPRSAIGQTARGEVLLLIIDGRAPGYSIGATLGDCADILKKYDAVQACNLDGGSSSIMYYNGREITKPSAANKVKGRAIPDGFMVYAKK